MGNPLHKFFKRLFTSTAKKEENKQEVVVENVEELNDEIYKELEIKSISDYICTKDYEKKVIELLLGNDITDTKKLNHKSIQLILSQKGMNEQRLKTMLTKFKGYIPFELVEQFFNQDEWTNLEVNPLEWKINLEILPIYKALKIKEVFVGSFFEPLCKLAKIKEITILDEINGEFLARYKQYAGVGEKKYKKTLEFLAQYTYKNSDFEKLGINQKEVVEDYVIHLEPRLYDIFKGYSLGQLGLLYGIEFPTGTRKIKIKQLEGKSINQVMPVVNRPKLERCLELIKKITVPSVVFAQIPYDEGIEVLKYRYKQELSLQDTANLLGKSLEEIGKVQIQTIDGLTQLIRKSKLVEILSYINKGDSHVPFEIVEKVVGEENIYILELIKHNVFSDLGYNPIFKMVFLNAETSEEELMSDLQTILPETFILAEYMDRIQDAIYRIGIMKWKKETINEILYKMGYILYGKFYSRASISSSFILETIFRDNIKRPLYLDEDTILDLKEIAQQKYNYTLESNLIIIEKLIIEIPEILQVGANTYLHSSRLKCKKEVLEAINEYLLNCSASQDKINANEAYKDLKEILKGSSIKDQYGLFSIINYCFGSKYKKEIDSLDIILKDKEVLEWELVGLEEVIPRLRQLISNALDNGSIQTEDFLQELLKQEQIAQFLVTNNIHDSKCLAQVLKQVEPTLSGEQELYR